MFIRFSFFLIFAFIINTVSSQPAEMIHGLVVDQKNEPVPDVNILIENTQRGVITEKNGTFRIDLDERDEDKFLIFTHVNYVGRRISVKELRQMFPDVRVVLEDSVRILNQVDVKDSRINDLDQRAGTYLLYPLESQFAPAPFQDISAILITLPGVSSVNEFSSAYSVRGGNYDENLVYVNNIPVYRPQIITAGQQEGLGFINLDLTEEVQFSSGGWETKYGDALSSAMNVRYKKPDTFSGSAQASLLGGSVHVEGSSRDRKFSYLAGARLKASEYLLNTLETDGEYRPRFTDLQTYLNYDISGKQKPGTSEIGVLFSYAKNRYLVQPTSRETTFGTFDNQLRLFVAFEGQERLTYDTWQTGINLSHRLNSKWNTQLILSGTYSREREYYDIESGYLLCNVDTDPTSTGFNKCLSNIGIGTNYYYGRNLLDARLVNIESRNEVIIDNANTLEFGWSFAHHRFDDRLSEYEFIDSADYVTITEAVQAQTDLSYIRLNAYLQNTSYFEGEQSLTYGIRVLYQDIGKNLLFSPRIQYNLKPEFSRNIVFRTSAGLYHQAPFYREFRNNQGEINDSLKAQSSVHAIAGIDLNFNRSGRPFKLTTEIYYKYFWNVNPYDIENVRIRYYAENIAKAYAAGIDFRISGEFIPGDESWFSLGLLSTKEDLETDQRGYIPRPMDQRVNLAIFFQDHIPGAPTFRVHLRLLYSSGLPFSPPMNPEVRNSFRGGEYQRVDIGFSKMLKLSINKKNPFFKSLWLSAEILNLTAHQNTISYYWVQDVNNYYYAVPNSLSQRFFNIRGMLKF